jgi:hypothetical protein
MATVTHKLFWLTYHWLPPGIYGSASIGDVGQTFFIPFSRKQPTEDSEGTMIEVFCGKDRRRIASISNHFCKVIKGNGIGNEVCSRREAASLM